TTITRHGTGWPARRSTADTGTASAGGLLVLTGSLDTSPVLAIHSTTANRPKIDSNATIRTVAISSANQTLEIGSGHAVSINAARSEESRAGTKERCARLTDTDEISMAGGTVRGCGHVSNSTDIGGHVTVSMD